jgi:hypothetical protein
MASVVLLVSASREKLASYAANPNAHGPRSGRRKVFAHQQGLGPGVHLGVLATLAQEGPNRSLAHGGQRIGVRDADQVRLGGVVGSENLGRGHQASAQRNASRRIFGVVPGDAEGGSTG